MRIHRLEVTAFGPFSETQTVDFDAMNDSGLFLLCGPTGAGKTSVLDAVCFGLFGDVPGDRSSAKRLRSDHAAPGVAPQVVLEATLGGRRFRLRRSPSWLRPKRRGTGNTTEQARVTLEESVSGEWVALSNRLDETGHLITDLVGMNVAQFCQVAMLPQGSFASFLRARSDERHKVLQQLFRTSRFEDLEKWLVAHRQSLKAENLAHQDAVSAVVSRLSEASGVGLLEDWDPRELAHPAERGELADWAEDLVRSAALTETSASSELDQMTERAGVARTALAQARDLVALRRQHDEALGIERSLAGSLPQAEESLRRLKTARRAQAVAPMARMAEHARQSADHAKRNLTTAMTEAATHLDTDALDLTRVDLAGAEKDAQQAAAVARALLPREAELKKAQATAQTTADSLAALDVVACELAELCRSLPGEIAKLRTDLSECTKAAAGIEEIERTQQQLRTQLAAAEKEMQLRTEIVAAREDLQTSVDAAQAQRERMHEIRELRINGMAAELALALASGESCPVCGSSSHPAVATPIDGAPTQADEDRARTEYETADFTRQARAEALSTLDRNVALARQASANKSFDELTAELATVTARRVVGLAARSERARLGESITAADLELTRARNRSTEVHAEMARLAQSQETARAVVDRVSSELAALFADGEVADSLDRLVESHNAASAVFGTAREALAVHDAAARTSDDASRNAAATASEHGFESVSAAMLAALSDDDITSLEAILRSRDTLAAKARSVLDDDRVAAAMAAEVPDTAALEQSAGAADDAQTDAGARVQLARNRSARLAALASELTAVLAAWGPTRAAYAVADSVSTLAEGKGADNALRMRLSGFVLAARLEQVVAAANERLGAMSDERYSLEHSSARGVGELRGGLSLLVRDEWTGESRDPATLSGGETFVVSLALALGLAGVVTQEAGGSDIDTLFIDEGFGTLDAETLDDVMDTLDGLRDGGRVLGIVSHVPEMRTRIPTQLQIRKDRSGSHIVATREAV